MKESYLKLIGKAKASRYLTVLVFMCCLCQATYAQLDFNWGFGLGSSGQDVATGTVVDASGNVYVSGHFADTLDFDPSSTAATRLGSDMAPDAFLAKYDPSGNLLWAKHIEGSTMPIYIQDMAVDGQGAVYLTGYFGGTVDFDPGVGVSSLTATGPFDIFLAKFDATGSFQWAHSFGGPTVDFGYGIATDAADNVIITGYFLVSADFDPSVNTAMLTSMSGSPDAFVAKYNSSGAYLWAMNLGSGTSQDQGNAVAVDDQDNIFVSGFFGGTTDFDPSTNTANITSAGASDMFIAKYTAAGNYVWAIGGGGSAGDAGEDVHLDAQGNVYLTGTFQGTAQFDPGGTAPSLVSAGNKDVFVAKYSNNGTFRWSLATGGTALDEGTSITTDTLGHVFTTGSFEGSAGFDPINTVNTIQSLGASDAFIACYDSSGNHIWSKGMGSIAADAGNRISVAGSTLFLAGSQAATMDLDFSSQSSNVVSMGGDDAFLAHYSLTCLMSSPLNLQEVICKGDSYTLGSQTLVTAGNYQEIFTSINGCDSVVNLQLAVDSVEAVVTRTALTLTATVTTPGVPTFQWIDCGTNTAISGETNATFTITVNGSYAVVATVNGCSDTSACVQVMDVGLEEKTATALFQVYPNPSSGNCFITLQQPSQVEVFNAQGQKVHSAFYEAGVGTLPLEHLRSGLYLVYCAKQQAPIKLLLSKP